ncbi:dehydrogenase [Vibrio breoganii]|uniref:Gfo/Idh/MocA family protein n=1 Tax=Vibrio breoganii TaxID=553239 RepID=UPI000C826879|nr:Gfo/Idh/MocA family oxidoreductase [Vibrio breoganii]PML05583.1 dehydrogenase [Vibrio breoganii]
MINWGIIAPGRIANRFAEAFSVINDGRLYGVASRRRPNAESFAKQHNITHVFDSYAELINCPEIDVIYIASPHQFHFDTAKQCLEAGKAVLCEKPLTVNASQAKALFQIAKDNNVFLMEALWSRFLPTWLEVKRWVEEGQIGQLENIHSTFGFKAERNYEDRLFNPKLAGGVLLDAGIYNISLTQYLAKREPQSISSHVFVGETNVDERCSATLDYGDFTSQFTCSFRSNLDNSMTIYGSDGKITIDGAFWDATKATLEVYGNDPIALNLPHEGSGFEYQVREVQSCLREGKLFSEVISPEQTIATLRLIDEILNRVSIKHPFS